MDDEYEVKNWMRRKEDTYGFIKSMAAFFMITMIVISCIYMGLI